MTTTPAQPAVLLSALAAAVPGARMEGPDRPVRALRYDSRQVGPGDLFFAWKGAASDGHRFIADACRQGAAGIVLEQPVERPETTAFIHVPDARRALARMAAAYQGEPGRRLALVGITGTNGKTTIAFAAKHLLGEPRQTGLVGTIRQEIGEAIEPAARTTPEGSDLQALLARMRDAGCTTAVMEVSSHALDQGRVEGLAFAAAVFTNLTPDHLDYHHTMEAYFEAKALLFDGRAEVAVINLDDPYGLLLLARLHGTRQVIGTSAAGNPEAVLRAENVRTSARGATFTLIYKDRHAAVEIPLLGHFNVANALGAAGAALALGRGFDEVAARLATLPPVPGRLERFGGGDRPTVVVDYAHTEDAVRQALATLRALRPTRLAVVLGCGGDRDRTKRPGMAAAALALADRVYFTSDNPRSETPEAIFADMRKGVPADAGALWIENRREAIAKAIADAAPGDIVCIAGKGHEATQEIAGVFHPFSDREVVVHILQERA